MAFHLSKSPATIFTVLSAWQGSAFIFSKVDSLSLGSPMNTIENFYSWNYKLVDPVIWGSPVQRLTKFKPIYFGGNFQSFSYFLTRQVLQPYWRRSRVQHSRLQVRLPLHQRLQLNGARGYGRKFARQTLQLSKPNCRCYDGVSRVGKRLAHPDFWSFGIPNLELSSPSFRDSVEIADTSRLASSYK